MHGFGRLTSAEVVTAFDLSRFRRFVDLGGGTGHLAMAMADRYPDMKTAVFDLPPAVDFAREFVDARVELIAGDFFRDPLPPADLYGSGGFCTTGRRRRSSACCRKSTKRCRRAAGC